MAYKHYKIACAHPDEAEAAMNVFLASHSVLKVEGKLVECGLDSYWAYQVEYVAGSVSHSNQQTKGTSPRVDYKEKLNEQDFITYVRLREKRKEIAEAEAIPPFAIFTNAQLAEMVEKKCRTLDELKSISGVGESRLKKHGAVFLEMLDTELKNDETEEEDQAE